MVVGSIGVHLMLATVLSTIDPGMLSLSPGHVPVAVRFVAPPPSPAAPPPLVEAPPPPVLTPVPPPERPRRAEPVEAPAPVPEAAPAPVTDAPPSLDDVFGDPPPAPGVMTGGSGAGGPAMASGPGGVAWGRPGGTGSAIGAGAPATDAEDDGLARRRARLAYKRELERLLRDRRSYPRAALRERLEGRVELALRIGRDGTVLGVRVAESSGYALLDTAALEAAHLDHGPAPPEAAALTDREEIMIPISYVVR
jgi:protein TonB